MVGAQDQNHNWGRGHPATGVVLAQTDHGTIVNSSLVKQNCKAKYCIFRFPTTGCLVRKCIVAITIKLRVAKLPLYFKKVCPFFMSSWISNLFVSLLSPSPYLLHSYGCWKLWKCHHWQEVLVYIQIILDFPLASLSVCEAQIICIRCFHTDFVLKKQ